MDLKRRESLKTALWAGALLPVLPAAASMQTLCIALLHLAPESGAVADNRLLVEKAIMIAAENRADWVVTPELCTSGYGFSERIGTDWIQPQPDEWMQALCRQVADLGVTVFLAHPEQDPRTKKLYNAVFVIGPDGSILGRHRKIRTLRHGAEAWSSPGDLKASIAVQPVGKVGVLICADAYEPGIALRLKEQGAKILISSAAWCPGHHGPNGEWERCTRETGLPLLVCNRTGVDTTLDFTHAESIVARDGRRLYSVTSASSAIFLIDWDLDKQAPASQAPRRIYIRN